MADRLRNLEVKLKLSKEGDAEVFREVSADLEGMANSAEKSIGKLQDKLQRGFGASAKDIAQAKVAIKEYRDALEEAEEAGGEIGEAARAQLDALDDKLREATDSVGEFRAEQQKAVRDIDDATKAAGGQAESINGLDDIVKKATESLGPGAAKWLSWGTAAVGAFTAGYEAGTKFREVMNDLTGGEFDNFIQKWYGLTAATEAWVGAADSAEDAAQRLKNQLNILTKNGIDPTGKSAEEVGQAVEDLAKKQKAAGEAVEQAANKRAEAQKKEDDAWRKSQEERAKAEEAKAKEEAAAAEKATQAAAKQAEAAAKADEKAAQRAAESTKRAADELERLNEAAAQKADTSSVDALTASMEKLVEAGQRATLTLQDVIDGKGSLREFVGQGRNGKQWGGANSGANAGEPEDDS